MRIHWTFLLPAVALTTAALGGCSQKPAPPGPTGRPLTVGFSQIGAESAWRTAETESIRDEAKKRGVDLKFSDAQGKQENQIMALRSFITQKVDAIILAPKIETGWEPVLREIKAANIPVILVDRGVTVDDDSLYTTLIASDFVEEGRMAGQWLVDKTGGKARIVELQGSTGAAPAIDRKKGFEEIIAKHPDMVIIKSQSGDFSRTTGKAVMEAFLKSDGKNIDVVYAHNDDMGIGAIQAIQEAGLRPGQDIIVVSIDGVKDAFKAMADGTLNASVECNPLLGPMAFDAVEAAVSGKPLEKKIIVQDRLFDQGTAAAELPNRKY